uniref:TAFII28-like protein domain-containing protein n=1 Tax=Phytophthora ramorum TaxID=164328 RepID=H3HCA7_PHYRM
MRQQTDGDELRGRASAARGQQQQHQPLAANDGNARGNYARNDQEPRPLSRSRGDRDWNARIRASISRLMEIDGICLDPESFSKGAEKRKATASQQAFHTRVDRLQAASEMAHQEYYIRLRDVYSASTAKKMRLTTTTNSPPPRRQNLLPSQENEGSERSPVPVHDPALAKAVEKLTSKMAELLCQLHATSDATAAEPILAAAASIALEATEMRRCEEVAMTRMVEIEEHRQQIMLGLLEYTKRKEKRGNDDGNANTSSVTLGGDAPASAADADMTQPSASEDEDEGKSLVARHGDVTTDDDPQESTADEEEDDEEDEVDSDEDTVELSDSASMLRLLQSLPEDEARRHEQFRRSHFERGAIKRVPEQCSATDKKAPSVNNVMAIVMAGMTKVFVGEITAEGT